jgi:predicted lipopolysaccharide heptosyltransferase III
MHGSRQECLPYKSPPSLKILILQLKRIGDLILTVPAIAALRRQFPSAEISLVVARGCADLLPAISGVDRSFVSRGTLADAGDWLRLARAKFDYALDFSRTDRSAFLTFLSAAAERITYDSVRRSAVRPLIYNQFIPASVRELHTVDYHLALLAPLGVHDATAAFHLDLPSVALEKADELLRQNGIAKDFAMVHPGSARAEKFWVAERWAEVIAHLHAQGRKAVLLTGGPSALEQRHLAQIKANLTNPVVDLSGQLDLLTLAALIKRAAILLTVDSAPMHLAEALNTPQVVLFGPTNPFHWRPRFTPCMILRAGNAAPLTAFEPTQPGAPMKEISTRQVIDAMETLLSAPAAPAL